MRKAIPGKQIELPEIGVREIMVVLRVPERLRLGKESRGMSIVGRQNQLLQDRLTFNQRRGHGRDWHPSETFAQIGLAEAITRADRPIAPNELVYICCD